jgi:inhibitor of KinA
MNNNVIPYQLFALGDSAITIDFGNCIDDTINNEVLARCKQLHADPFPGMIELIPAYSSLTICYDMLTVKKKLPAEKTAFETIKDLLTLYLNQPVQHHHAKTQLIKIPVCYSPDFGTDLQFLAATNKISTEEIIQVHTSREYKVFMLGFLPGFAYLGEVDERIAIPRKPQPKNVMAGSVGIAGKQTGIYPLTSPGGWQIIGKTPVRIFNVNDPQPALLKAGDRIQFFPISRNEFDELNNSA